MGSECQHPDCGAEPLSLCPGHLRAFILSAVAEALDAAAVGLYRDLEPEPEDD